MFLSRPASPALHRCALTDPARTPAHEQLWCRCGADWVFSADPRPRWVLVRDNTLSSAEVQAVDALLRNLPAA